MGRGKPGATRREGRPALKQKDRPFRTGPSVQISVSPDQKFLFAAAAALLTASLVACLASPTAFWPLPLISCTAPSPCRRSEPTASPTPCLALPSASLVAPLTLSAVAPMGTLLCCQAS